MRNVFILGMHRSGTSAVAGALAANGFYAGERLLPADPGFNDTGFFEHEDIVAIHDEFFRAFNLDWRYCYQLPEDCFDSNAAKKAKIKIGELLVGEYSAKQPWCIKDPRACVLFPLWRDVLEKNNIEYSVLITHRAPGDIAASLKRRDSLEHNQSLLLWLVHSLAAEKHTRGLRRAFLDYESFLKAPEESLVKTLRELGIEQEKMTSLGVEQRFNHAGGSDVNCPDLILRAENLLGERPKDTELLDQISVQISNTLPLIPGVLPLERAAERWRNDLELSQDHIQNVEKSVEALHVSLAEERGKYQAELANALELKATIEREKDAVGELKVQLAKTEAQLQSSESALSNANASFAAISSSFFWRSTRPLRYLVERLRRVRRVQTPRSFHQIAIKPEYQMQLKDGWYVSEGEDPQLLLISDQAHSPEGRVEIQFSLETGSVDLEPVLYVSHGFEGHITEFQIQKCEVGVNKFQLILPTHTNSIRFDPIEGSGQFKISGFTIREMY